MKGMTEEPKTQKSPPWLKAKGQGLSEVDCEMLMKMMRPVQIYPGQVLFEEGERDDEVLFIESGKVEVGHRDPPPEWLDQGPYGMVDLADHDGREWVPVRTAKSGECLGEPGFCCNEAHSFTAIAKAEGRALVLDGRQIKPLLAQDPNLGCRLVKAVQGSLMAC